MSTFTTSDVTSSDKVEGSDVYNTAGDKLGSVDDPMIDKRSGQVRYAVLEFGGFLGRGIDRYPLPWGMLKLRGSTGAAHSAGERNLCARSGLLFH